MHPHSSENNLHPQCSGKEGALKQGRIQEVSLTTHMAHHLTEHCDATKEKSEREGEGVEGGGGRGRERERERERAGHTMLRPFNNGVSAVTFGTHLERVRRRRRTCSGPLVCVSLVRIPLAIRISLQMTRPPNYPKKIPKHASHNLTEDLMVRKERDFTLG